MLANFEERYVQCAKIKDDQSRKQRKKEAEAESKTERRDFLNDNQDL